jgi:hypothetical protein
MRGLISMRGTKTSDRIARSTRLTAVLLAVSLFAQLLLSPPDHELRASASWTHFAASLDQAKALSAVIVVGHVERVAAGNDIVVPARGEPNSEDRVACELVTIAVDRTYKGRAPNAILLFHTALERTDATPAPLPASVSPPPNRATPAAPTETESRRVLLDGDPPYQVGEHYVLFLTPGPTIGGVATLAVIAPEGRYLLDWPGTYRDESHLHAVTKRAFAPQYDDRPVGPLLTAIGPPGKPGLPSGSPTPTPAPTPTPTQKPRNDTGRRNTAAIAGVAAAVALVLLGGGAHLPGPTTPGTNGLGPPQGLTPGATDTGHAPSLQTPAKAGGVTLGWQPPAHGLAARYAVVVFSSATGGTVVFQTTTSSPTATVPGRLLVPGLYRWTVAAIDASNAAGPTAPMLFFRIARSNSSGTNG